MDPLGTQRANHVPASTESGSQAPASQSPDSNQNINNQETTPVALTFTMILETHTGQSSNRCRFPSALEWRVALCTFAKQTKNKTKQNPDPLSVSCLLLTRSVCGQEHTVLLLGPVYQLPLLLLVPLLLCFGWSLPCNGGKRKADWSEKAFSRKESTKHGEFLNKAHLENITYGKSSLKEKIVHINFDGIIIIY